MATKTAPISVGFISLGCAKNLVDSQIMADRLLEQGLCLAPSPEDADVVVVNTCAFIEDARQESIEMILSACALKDGDTCRAVLVAGCLPQRYREDLKAALPGVDAFLGLDALDDIGNVVQRIVAGAGGAGAVVQVSPTAQRLYEPGAAGVVFTGGPYAYLKIAEGCDHRCAFCAIPGIRGAHRSRSIHHIVAEAERLLDKGFRELNVISQDTTAYGCDLNDGSDLGALLRALGRLGGDFWIRVLYTYPTRLSAALLDAMGETGQVCPYVDVPIQHSHPDMLRAMHRADTVPHVPELTHRLRDALPGMTVRTTCLVGFPGETDAHFEHLCRAVAAAEYDHLGVFAFSPEEGTPAADMEDTPPPELAHARREQLMTLQKTIVQRRSDALIGTPTTLLMERPVLDEPGVWMGRVRCQAPEVDGDTFIEDVPGSPRAGEFMDVRFAAHADYDFRVVPA